MVISLRKMAKANRNGKGNKKGNANKKRTVEKIEGIILV